MSKLQRQQKIARSGNLLLKSSIQQGIKGFEEDIPLQVKDNELEHEDEEVAPDTLEEAGALEADVGARLSNSFWHGLRFSNDEILKTVGGCLEGSLLKRLLYYTAASKD
ncbi:uncharacterized protein LOC126370894 isoform X2 [Pectinophora gossypiella]|nr:uncharacterized protein LOC126370894 isoform X2 [Pectinophora gossypiella]